MEVLKAMPSRSWNEYKKALARKGYSVHERKDKKGDLRVYALVKGNTKYKTSELGVGRNLMISKLPRTWQKLHYREMLAAQVNTSQNRWPEAVKDKLPARTTLTIVPARCPTRFPPMAELNSGSIFRSRYSTASTRSSTTGRLPTAAS